MPKYSDKLSRLCGPQLALALAVVTLSGCSTTGARNEACVSLTSIPTGVGNCVQAYDVAYKYTNGPRPQQPFGLYHTSTPGVIENYVAQRSENHCYAAALSTAFKSQGIQYAQEVFPEVMAKECFATGQQRLSFSQIFFSATRANGRPGIWFVDMPDRYFSSLMSRRADSALHGQQMPLSPASQSVSLYTWSKVCQSRERPPATAWAEVTFDPLAWMMHRKGHTTAATPPVLPTTEPYEVTRLRAMNLYQSTTWTKDNSPRGREDGFYAPLHDPRDVFYKMLEDKATIVAGMDGGAGGHVVVVSKIVWATLAESNPAVHPAYYAATVEVVDPAAPEVPVRLYSGDDFFNQARFLLAIANKQRGPQ